jgi:hypothetical protein
MMHFSKVIAFGLCIGILGAAVASAAVVTYYEFEDFYGPSRRHDLKPNTCYNLKAWKHRISSIDTHGNCVILWTDEDCTGRKLVVAPRKGCILPHKLLYCGFGDSASSIQLC